MEPPLFDSDVCETDLPLAGRRPGSSGRGTTKSATMRRVPNGERIGYDA